MTIINSGKCEVYSVIRFNTKNICYNEINREHEQVYERGKYV